MSRATLKRLESLEQKALPDDMLMHVLLGDAESLARQERDLKASSKWGEGDEIMLIELVPGPGNEGR